MPKPKLPDEDKKEVVPLRLPREAVEAVQDLAQAWGDKRGKEVKSATVARELVLIGLGVVAVARQSKMLADLLRQGDDLARLPKIRQMLNESMSNGVAAEEVAHAIIKLLKAELPEPPSATTNTPFDQFPDDELIEATPYEKNTTTLHRKGGRKG